MATALRETREELGVAVAATSVWGQLRTLPDRVPGIGGAWRRGDKGVRGQEQKGRRQGHGDRFKVTGKAAGSPVTGSR